MAETTADRISFGFRKYRSPEDAREYAFSVLSRKDSPQWILEGDIKSCFDKISHQWMLENIPTNKRIMKEFMRCGYIEKGHLYPTIEGSPQGNGSSPVLANVYLHYVLDMWFEIRMKKQFRGEAYLIRYADDFIGMFQYKADAELFYAQMRERFMKYGLELAEEKTRILEFGRFAVTNRKERNEGKPESIDFLGFTMYCSTNKWGKFTVKLKTNRKKTKTKLVKLNVWLRDNRELGAVEMIKRINLSLNGHYRYYGVSYNFRCMRGFRFQVIKLLFKWLNRRSQKKSYTWKQFKDLLKYYPIVYPKIYVNLFE